MFDDEMRKFEHEGGDPAAASTPIKAANEPTEIIHKGHKRMKV